MTFMKIVKDDKALLLCFLIRMTEFVEGSDKALILL